MFKFKCQFYGLNDELQWFVHLDFEGRKARSSYKRAEPSRTIKSGTKNYLLNVFQDPGRIFCSYSKLEKLLAAIKSFMFQKRSRIP